MCAGVCLDGGPFALGEFEVWSLAWRSVGDQFAEVRDPAHGQPHQFAVYRVRRGRRSVAFAAGEFSNLVWGFYITRRTKARLGAAPQHTSKGSARE